MSRIRTVKPEFWSSEQVIKLSIPARLCFIGLWNHCDDAGIHTASAITLKAQVFPCDDIDAAPLVQELIEQGLVVEYEADDKRYWHVTGWHHQKIDRPNWKHPLPDGSIPKNKTKDEPGDNYDSIRRVFDECSTSNHPRKGR